MGPPSGGGYTPDGPPVKGAAGPARLRPVRSPQYATYRSRGLPIGSGVIEAACKSIVQQRMKGPGMRWGAAGGPAILSARTAALKGILNGVPERPDELHNDPSGPNN